MALGAILATGVSLAGLASQVGAQSSSTNLAYANLFEQKRQAQERERLAKATRTDAYGNAVRYIPGQGFVTETTPITKAILDSQQKEQLAQFRDDAPRQRAASQRIDERSKEAGEVFDDRFSEYRYSRRKSEDEFVAEAIRDALASRREGDPDSLNAISRLALRTNNTQALPELLRAAKSQGSGRGTLAEAIANAKKQGKQQFHADRNANTQSTFGELNQLRSIADKFVPANLNFANENNALSGRADNALAALLQTSAQNSNAISNASRAAISTVGKPLNFSGLASAVSRIPSPKSDGQNYLAELLLEQRIGNAELGIRSNNRRLDTPYKSNTGTF